MRVILSAIFLFALGAPTPSFAHDNTQDTETARPHPRCNCAADCLCKKPGGTCYGRRQCTRRCKCQKAVEKPTYKIDPSQVGKFQTGMVRGLTMEQYQAAKEFPALAEDENWKFDYNVEQIGKYALGFSKPKDFVVVKPVPTPSKAGKVKPVDFRQILGNTYMPIINQGNCGSCVVCSFTANAQLSMALRNVAIPTLSQGHLMNCGSGMQCNGAYGEQIAGDLVKLGSLAQLTDYPYVPKTGACRQTPSMPRFGQFKSWKTISGSFQSIVEALNERQPVSVGIAADSRFMSYAGGVYNGFGSMQTNHYVLAVGATCGTSVDSQGNCLFDSQGRLAKGNTEAQIIIQNSWGDGWGERGFVTMQFENASGKRNNNVAGGDGNAQVIDTGIPITPPKPVGPVEFTMDSDLVVLKVKISEGAKYTAEEARALIQTTLDALLAKLDPPGNAINVPFQFTIKGKTIEIEGKMQSGAKVSTRETRAAVSVAVHMLENRK